MPGFGRSSPVPASRPRPRKSSRGGRRLAITKNGGEESACGWCKDRWGFSWQITPDVLLKAIDNPDRAAAKRAYEAMTTMGKIDIATIEAALKG